MKRHLCLALVLVAVVCLAACGAKTVVLGSANPSGGSLQTVNPGKLTLAFTRYLDTYVQIEYTFASRMNTTAKEGYQTLLAQSEFGAAYVLVKNGLYATEVVSLREGDTIRLNGRVSAVKLPTDDLPKTTIIIDE